jgi:CYTH domain-containing protein
MQLFRAPVLTKTRYEIPYAGKTWEVDVFHGPNEGLIVAEIELESETETFGKPDWIGEEVTGDKRYLNASLVVSPWSAWASGD